MDTEKEGYNHLKSDRERGRFRERNRDRQSE